MQVKFCECPSLGHKGNEMYAEGLLCFMIHHVLQIALCSSAINLAVLIFLVCPAAFLAMVSL